MKELRRDSAPNSPGTGEAMMEASPLRLRRNGPMGLFHPSTIQYSSTPKAKHVTSPGGSRPMDISRVLQEAYESPIRGHKIKKSNEKKRDFALSVRSGGSSGSKESPRIHALRGEKTEGSSRDSSVDGEKNKTSSSGGTTGSRSSMKGSDKSGERKESTEYRPVINTFSELRPDMNGPAQYRHHRAYSEEETNNGQLRQEVLKIRPGHGSLNGERSRSSPRSRHQSGSSKGSSRHSNEEILEDHRQILSHLDDIMDRAKAAIGPSPLSDHLSPLSSAESNGISPIYSSPTRTVLGAGFNTAPVHQPQPPQSMHLSQNGSCPSCSCQSNQNKQNEGSSTREERPKSAASTPSVDQHRIAIDLDDLEADGPLSTISRPLSARSTRSHNSAVSNEDLPVSARSDVRVRSRSNSSQKSNTSEVSVHTGSQGSIPPESVTPPRTDRSRRPDRSPKLNTVIMEDVFKTYKTLLDEEGFQQTGRFSDPLPNKMKTTNRTSVHRQNMHNKSDMLGSQSRSAPGPGMRRDNEVRRALFETEQVQSDKEDHYEMRIRQELGVKKLDVQENNAHSDRMNRPRQERGVRILDAQDQNANNNRMNRPRQELGVRKLDAQEQNANNNRINRPKPTNQQERENSETNSQINNSTPPIKNTDSETHVLSAEDFLKSLAEMRLARKMLDENLEKDGASKLANVQVDPEQLSKLGTNFKAADQLQNLQQQRPFNDLLGSPSNTRKPLAFQPPATQNLKQVTVPGKTDAQRSDSQQCRQDTVEAEYESGRSINNQTVTIEQQISESQQTLVQNPTQNAQNIQEKQALAKEQVSKRNNENDSKETKHYDFCTIRERINAIYDKPIEDDHCGKVSSRQTATDSGIGASQRTKSISDQEDDISQASTLDDVTSLGAAEPLSAHEPLSAREGKTRKKWGEVLKEETRRHSVPDDGLSDYHTSSSVSGINDKYAWKSIEQGLNAISDSAEKRLQNALRNLEDSQGIDQMNNNDVNSESLKGVNRQNSLPDSMRYTSPVRTEKLGILKMGSAFTPIHPCPNTLVKETVITAPSIITKTVVTDTAVSNSTDVRNSNMRQELRLELDDHRYIEAGYRPETTGGEQVRPGDVDYQDSPHSSSSSSRESATHRAQSVHL